ncbi:hypothetical protein Ae168Ps1_2725 [Pseudonocardia sp. Ae168_Ps1]|uniref:hypothetical protein n=1 Tax=unclassified Pseudonocardia TaxID=2619320 RepID=UPI00094AAD8F|nr:MULTISPECIES: hypothetical protein [unclassified Pseudonocardia]OLL74337.1 hypothetical protein Ae150APs1_2715 [Pseudonocardia sp. Ae150A_Ps1]OLL80319.1 hypothetical protein Ae168Ps1_2725 [Pseudonocardia sp. Ae168_Ps1]OLL85555.1 hypothetical protein Ae263Ps1_2610c [Pseudonocardia sp. Ae263_Ps1]OLL94417.1 hypothetical protein Ae356Ps1_4314 [Pseudonocardia sp. Ae356_Ps1]
MIGRALVGWLMRSRARFFGVVAAVIVAALLLSSLTGQAPDPAPEAAAPAPTTAPPSTTAPPPTSSAAPAPPPAPARQPLPPRELAVKVAELWVDSSPAQSEWLARLKPLVTEEYGAVTLSQVDPRNVPALQVVGPARDSESPDPGTAAVDVPLDTLTLRVEMIDTGPGGWLVTELAPEDEQQGTA